MDSSPKYQSLLLLGLAQAFASPSELPLFASKSISGLFPSNILGKAAAQAALQSEWLALVRSEIKGKSTIKYVRITDTGCTYLLEQTDPKPLLAQVQSQFSQQEITLRQLQLNLRSAQDDLERLRNRLDQMSHCVSVREVTQTKVQLPAWEDRLTQYLSQRQTARPAEDCPLPELFQQARQIMPDLSVGTFHDGLRRLQAERRIALQPWTGPLHELPEPNLALLQGHSLAFYASPQG